MADTSQPSIQDRRCEGPRFPPAAVPANQAVAYQIDLHTNAHAFLKGHRIMAPVQSTWFPLYDRNPQKFAPNIFEAHADGYVKATQRIYRAARGASAVARPVVTGR